jgi:opacity protein-like surface antigen
MGGIMRKVLLITALFIAAFVVTASAGATFTNGGIRAGIVTPEDLDNTFGIGGHLGFGSPVENLDFSFELGYWEYSESVSILGTTFDTKFSDISLGLSAKYEVIAVPNRLYPYIGGGFGIHFFNVEVLGISDSESKFAFQGFGGMRFPVSPVFSLFAEARYTVVEPDHLGLFGGVSYNFAK